MNFDPETVVELIENYLRARKQYLRTKSGSCEMEAARARKKLEKLCHDYRNDSQKTFFDVS